MTFESIRKSSLTAMSIVCLLTLLPGCPGTMPPGMTNGTQVVNNPPAPNPIPPAANPNPNPAPPPAPPITPVLFITDTFFNSVVSYKNPATVNGDIAPDANLTSNGVDLNYPTDVMVDSSGALLVTNTDFVEGWVSVFDDAVNTNGMLTADRNVRGLNTDLVYPRSLTSNAADDLVFITDTIPTPRILVYDHNPPSAFQGNLAPIRTITSMGNLSNPIGIDFGLGDDLYVCNNGGKNILVFANASTLNADVAPTRTIEHAGFNVILDVVVDDNDTMYVVNGFAPPQIFVFHNASTLNSVVAPDSVLTLDIDPGEFLWGIAVDSAGTGYIADMNNGAIYSYDNLATRNATLGPDRTIAGPSTQIKSPKGLYLLE